MNIGNINFEVLGIADDSRKVKDGFLFVAIKGLTVDGHKFISQAIKNGAKVIVGEEDLRMDNVKYVKVKDSRKEFGILASEFYGKPSEKLTIIGVTGTDGKTTTSNLIYQILKTARKKVGLISTINAKIGDKIYDTGFHVTNPGPIELQKLLSEMVKQKCEYVVLEVTSQGLDQERNAGIKFKVGVLTNITREHLDYHKTMKKYIAAKGKLFERVEYAVLNANNESPLQIKPYLNNDAKDIYYNFKNLDEKIKIEIENKFEQSYNRENAAAAVETSKIFGVNSGDVVKAIRFFPELSGRMEEIKNNRGIRIYIDFAHTPNALENVLDNLSKQKGNFKLICVFGCASERDNGKRPLMGKISAKIADVSIFTAEDPRSEEVSQIINQMKKGVKNKLTQVYGIPERGEAIYFAINKVAKKNDIVVICGKGHEKSMAYNGKEYDWSDQDAVKLALEGRIKEINWK